MPNKNPVTVIIPIARFLFNPKSMSVRVESSTIDINEVTAAKNNARKKIEAKNKLTTPLPDIWLNNIGKYIKVNPVFAGPD